MIRIPTAEELSGLQNEPRGEDRLFGHDDDGPEAFPLPISKEILERREQMQRFHDMVQRYYAKFLDMAIDAGLTAEFSRFPGMPRLHYEYLLAVNLTDDESVIEQELEEFKKAVLEEVRRHKSNAKEGMKGYYELFFQEQVKNPRGIAKKHQEIEKRLERAARIYPMVNPENQQFEAIASELRFNPKSHDDAAVQKVKRDYRDAVRLVEAAANGTFLNAISKPVRDKA